MSDRAEVLGRQLSGTLIALGLEADLLPFAQIVHSGALDGGDVDEHIL
jgi:hypothetical protein